ncbi:MAG: hypothetical protein ABI355_00350 [Solirubrobacteraceae bacterium]
MYRRNRSTRSGGIPLPDYHVPAKMQRAGRRRGKTLHALVELARVRRQLTHVPTVMQVRAMAHFDGREPCSYLLDPKVNCVPELPLGGEDPVGRHGLCFTGRHPDSGRRFELVTLPDGCAFDLLGMSG